MAQKSLNLLSKGFPFCNISRICGTRHGNGNNTSQNPDDGDNHQKFKQSESLRHVLPQVYQKTAQRAILNEISGKKDEGEDLGKIVPFSLHLSSRLPSRQLCTKQVRLYRRQHPCQEAETSIILLLDLNPFTNLIFEAETLK